MLHLDNCTIFYIQCSSCSMFPSLCKLKKPCYTQIVANTEPSICFFVFSPTTLNQFSCFGSGFSTWILSLFMTGINALFCLLWQLLFGRILPQPMWYGEEETWLMGAPLCHVKTSVITLQLLKKGVFRVVSVPGRACHICQWCRIHASG